MKAATVLLFALSLLSAGAARAAEPCPGGPASLVVAVAGVRPAQGTVVITLYPDDARRFLAKNGKLARQRVPAAQAQACFRLPGPGTYGVAVYHDANNDGKFNRSLIGLPTEGFGFSNDAPTPVGLPDFKAVRFPAKAGETDITVRLRYLGKDAAPKR